MVEHLRDLHGEVQTLCSLEAYVADRTVAQAAAGPQAPAELTAAAHVHERLQDGGFAAAGGRTQRTQAHAAATERGQQTVQRPTEQAGQEHRGTGISGNSEQIDSLRELRGWCKWKVAAE